MAMPIAFDSIAPAASIDSFARCESAAGDRADDEERLGAGGYGVGQRRVRRFVREIFLAREEPHERSPPLRLAIANRSAKHRVSSFDRVKDRPLRHRRSDLNAHLPTIDGRERSQMLWKDDSYHGETYTLNW